MTKIGRPFRSLSLFCGLVLPLAVQAQSTPQKAPLNAPSNVGPVTAGGKPHMIPDSFADLTAKLSPAVVNISISATLKPGEGDDEEGGDDDQGGQDGGPQVPEFPPGSPMDKFFHQFMDRNGAPDAAPRKIQALGSGFVIDPSGYIVTNNHVVKDADKVSVTLQDNTVLPAKIVGRDAGTDLALLKVESKTPLPYVPLGDSDRARVGDWVLAIGNPFGLSGTVTAGIVSSRGRDIKSGLYDDFIQTDAAINKGNSGGPLFNLNGEVVGINTAIYAPSGGSVGIGFSIPSNDARGIIEQLRKTGHVSRGWIGIRFQDVTQEIADGLGLKPARGALVAGVDAKGPAQKAGLQTGDVIVSLDGKPVDGRALPRLVAQLAAGSTVHFGVWRKGKSLDLPLTVAASPDQAQVVAKGPAGPKSLAFSELGLSAARIDDDARQKYGLTDDQRGVLVAAVDAGGAAASRGVKVGDVITEIGQTEIDTPDALRRGIDEARAQKRKSVVVLVQNADGLRWVPFPF